MSNPKTEEPPAAQNQATPEEKKSELVKSDNLASSDQKPNSEAQIPPEPISYFKLFALADCLDFTFAILGALSAMGAGVCMPISSIFLGKLNQAFDQVGSPDDMINRAYDQMVLILILGAIVLVLAACTITFWTILGKRMGIKYRIALLKSILMEKNVSWFDKNDAQELPNKFVTLCTNIETALGPKIGTLFMSISMAISGVVIGYIHGWQLALALTGLFPIIAITMGIFTAVVMNSMPDIEKAYGKSAAIAEETLSSIRTVYSSCSEKREIANYSKNLEPAKTVDTNLGFYTGLSLGIATFAMDITMSLGYYIGSFFIEYNVYNNYSGRNYLCQDAMIVLMSLQFGFYCIGMTAPSFKAIQEGRSAGTEILKIIEDDKSKKISEGTTKIADSEFKGKVEFNNVTFVYPAEPTLTILNSLSIEFESGKTTAICGETKCGKSTIFQLLEGFYYANQGEVTIDGVPIKELDLNWLRSKIGFVGQEPVLFNTSIRENIKYGNNDATDQDILEACKKANCYDFVMKLPDKLDTIVGNEGGQVSGGEKQRIALARAIVRKPKILLLDETTSALDRENEIEVQRGIKNTAQGITTVIIAHRLSTIKDADKIIVIKDGILAEQGKHDDLMALNGLYASMYSATSQFESVRKISEVHIPTKNAELHEISIKIDENPASGQNSTTQKESDVKKEIIPFTEAFKNVIGENRDNTAVLIMSLIFSVLLGIRYPAIGALAGAMIYDLLLFDDAEMRRNLNLELGLVIGISAVCSIMMFLSIKLSGSAAAEVAHRTRVRLYEKFMTMHIGWFERIENAPAKLGSILMVETKKINGVLDSVLGFFITSIVAGIVAIGVGLYFDWRIALVASAIFPFIIGSGILDAKIFSGKSEGSDDAFANSLMILTESVKNIRTVLSFSGESKIVELYAKSLREPFQKSIPKAVLSGVLWGIGQFLQFGAFGILNYLGAVFIKEHDLPIKNMFISFNSLILTAYCIGQSLAYCPDIGEALQAITQINEIFNTPSEIMDTEKSKELDITGKIEFKNVTFKYPSKKFPVLNNVSFVIPEGKKVGIVGISGSGKSTIIQLLERFYEPQSGEILIDGVPIKEIKLSILRKQFGLVLQEPTIFNRTISENIGYSIDSPTKEKIESAAEKAKAFEFISKFTEGFEKIAGVKGNKLSGGERQRIAIARAIIKDPKVILLDEATSALDDINQGLVLRNLENVMDGKTKVFVAHRLSTIQESDNILVLENGKIIEEGNHEKLMNLKGRYYQLQTGSNKAKNN